MSDDELDRHLKAILVDMEHGLERRCLRLIIEEAVQAERERCAKIADACAKERHAALADFPVVLTPSRSMAFYTVAAKQSEAERIASAIRETPP